MAIRTAISFVLTGQPLTWDQAYSLSQTTSGSLWKFTESAEATRQMMRNMAEASPRNNLDEDLFWVGAHRKGSSWIWTDGTTVATSYFDPKGVNADDNRRNDSEFVAYNSILRDPSGPFESSVTGFILEYFENISTGTQFSDWFVTGGAGPGQTVKMLGGDDFYIDSSDYFPNAASGGTVDGGSGNDVIAIYSGSNSTVVDGDGQDFVEVYSGQIKASSDGDNDVFFAPKVAYETAKIGMVVNGSIVSSSEIGVDQILGGPDGNGPALLYTGEGADTVINWNGTKVYTRGGDDIVFIGSQIGVSRWADGGGGNDELTAGHAGGTLIGGAGNDILRLNNWSGQDKVEMTGGAGSDTFAFDVLNSTQATKAIINDFAAKGAVQDHLDLTSYDLGADSAQEALADGLLTITSSKGYTYISLQDGGSSNDLTLMLKGTFGSEIHDNIWL